MNLLDRIKFGPAVIALLVLLSCEDPSEIGLVLTPDDQIGVFFKDFPVNINTTLIDSIDSRTVDENAFSFTGVFGRYQNAQFGTVKASLNSQFVPVEVVSVDTSGNVVTTPIPTDAQFISCSMRIISPLYNSLDFSVPQSLKIYRVHEDFDPDRIYYTKDTISTINPLTLQPDLIGEDTFTFFPKPDTINLLDISIPLTDEFGMQLLQAGINTVDQNGTFGSFSNFKQIFKGISIVPGDGSNAVFGVQLNNLVNGILLEYTTQGVTGLDTVGFIFPMYAGTIDQVVGFNSYNVDRTGTVFDGLDFYEELQNDNGIAYAQAGTGLAIRLDFDSMTTFFEDIELVKINRAEIIMDGVMGNEEENAFEIPSALFYNYTDFNNLFVKNLDSVTYTGKFDEAITVLQFNSEILAPSSEFLLAELEGEQYNSLVTLYTQAVLDDILGDFDFMALPFNYKASFNHFSVRKEDIRMRVYYTTFVE